MSSNKKWDAVSYAAIKKFLVNIDIDGDFADAIVALSPDKSMNVHLNVVARFEYFKMIYDRDGFRNLPIEKRIFSFPDYKEEIIAKVVELIYYREPAIDDVVTYREIRKLCDFIGLLGDEFIKSTINSYMKTFNCEWEIYDSDGRRDINIIIDKKAGDDIINATTCTEIVSLPDDMEFLNEINKILLFNANYADNSSTARRIYTTICIILTVRILLFNRLHGVYHTLQLNKNMLLAGLFFNKELKLCPCLSCKKYGIFCPLDDYPDAVNYYKNILTNAAFKVGVTNNELSAYISQINETPKPKKRVCKKACKKAPIEYSDEDLEGEEESSYEDDEDEE